MTEGQKLMLRHIANMLETIEPVVYIPDEVITIPVETEHGPDVWVGNTTTYTLSLMLKGMILEDEEATSSERR